MADRREHDGWMSVPEFGGWARTSPGDTNYSMVFGQARANRKYRKTNVMRLSLGDEREAMTVHHHHQDDDSVVPKTKRNIFSYLNCCIVPSV